MEQLGRNRENKKSNSQNNETSNLNYLEANISPRESPQLHQVGKNMK